MITQFAEVTSHPRDKEFIGYRDLPYGVWINSSYDVIYNRQYKALWQRQHVGLCQRVRPKHFRELFKNQDFQERFFWNDWSNPLSGPEAWKYAENVLLAFITGRGFRRYLIDEPYRLVYARLNLFSLQEEYLAGLIREYGKDDRFNLYYRPDSALSYLVVELVREGFLIENGESFEWGPNFKKENGA